MPTNQRLNAEIVTTGTEILLGEIVDTNAAWIAQQLRDCGVNLYYKTTVGDNMTRVREVLEAGLARSDVIIVTGGLGPTVDDITRDAIAAAMGQPLVLDEASLQELHARFAGFGAVMTPNNERQAYIPRGAVIIENPVGTAPAFRIEDERGMIIALPGVPREMKHIMTASVLPFLRERSGDTGVIERRVLRTVGVGESWIDAQVADLMTQSNPTVGLAAHFGQVDVRITASAPDQVEVTTLLNTLEAEVRQRIGPHIYSTTPGEPFPGFVVELLLRQGANVALVEASADAPLAKALREADPAAAPIAAAWSAADDAAALGLDALALADITPEVARRAAERARDQAGATYGLALLAREDASAGETFVALAGPDGVAEKRLAFGARDGFNQLRANNQALILLWRALAPEVKKSAAP